MKLQFLPGSFSVDFCQKLPASHFLEKFNLIYNYFYFIERPKKSPNAFCSISLKRMKIPKIFVKKYLKFQIIIDFRGAIQVNTSVWFLKVKNHLEHWNFLLSSFNNRSKIWKKYFCRVPVTNQGLNGQMILQIKMTQMEPARSQRVI